VATCALNENTLVGCGCEINWFDMSGRGNWQQPEFHRIETGTAASKLVLVWYMMFSRNMNTEKIGRSAWEALKNIAQVEERNASRTMQIWKFSLYFL